MATIAPSSDDPTLSQNTSWGQPEDSLTAPIQGNGHGPSANGTSLAGMDDSHEHPGQDSENQEYAPRGSSVGAMSVSGLTKADSYRGEKQIKPNKVYVGGLPEHTRPEDLQSCFGKMGTIVNIELKVGYGFVEFDDREAAEASVQKYHEGTFMGNKIRVELSHGGGRTAKYAGEPGACFRCGQQGHWARECPSQAASGGPPSRRSQPLDGPLIDRIARDYPARPPPPREDYPRYPPRDPRYEPYPPPAITRDYRRPPSPGYRDYPPVLPRGREYDDYRRGPPVPPPPMHDRERYPMPPTDYARGRYAPPPLPDAYRPYPGPPPPAAPYDRYDRRPAERYPSGYPPLPPGGRPRSPPLPRDYDRPPPPRDYPDYRGRPASPPRYPPNDYPRVSAEPPNGRYRRRSMSPGPAARSPVPYDPYPTNGYSGNVQAIPPPRRDYPVPPRSNRELDPAPYRRP